LLDRPAEPRESSVFLNLAPSNPLPSSKITRRFQSVVSRGCDLKGMPLCDFRKISGSFCQQNDVRSSASESARTPRSPSSRHRGVETANQLAPRVGQYAECNFFREVVESAQSSTGSKRSSMRNSSKNISHRSRFVPRRMRLHRKRYRHHSLRQCRSIV